VHRNTGYFFNSRSAWRWYCRHRSREGIGCGHAGRGAGDGDSLADPERSGPAVAVVVNETAYLVVAGRGVRRAAAAEKNGIKALAVKNLKIVFITHLHSTTRWGIRT